MSDPTRADDPTGEGPSGQGAGAAALPLLLGLLQGGAGLPSLMMALAEAPLTPEQRAVMELLGALGNRRDDDDDDDDDDIDEPRRRAAWRAARYGTRYGTRYGASPPVSEPVVDVPFYSPPEPEPDPSSSDPSADEMVCVDVRTLARMRQELASLREVNDTLAAALGACRACWGGEAHCPLCGGHGSSGASPPDPPLFEALVVPAVRRMRARAHPSPTTEDSP
jgi:hypothetical protein